MIDYAIELGQEVVAITDHECVSNAVRVEKYYNSIKENNPNFKLIRGNEIYLVRNGLNAVFSVHFSVKLKSTVPIFSNLNATIYILGRL